MFRFTVSLFFVLLCHGLVMPIITLANHDRCKQHNEAMKTQSNTCNRHQACEKTCKEVMIGVSNNANWLRKWGKFLFNRLLSAGKQITFDTQLLNVNPLFCDLFLGSCLDNKIYPLWQTHGE